MMFLILNESKPLFCASQTVEILGLASRRELSAGPLRWAVFGHELLNVHWPLKI